MGDCDIRGENQKKLPLQLLETLSRVDYEKRLPARIVGEEIPVELLAKHGVLLLRKFAEKVDQPRETTDLLLADPAM